MQTQLEWPCNDNRRRRLQETAGASQPGDVVPSSDTADDPEDAGQQMAMPSEYVARQVMEMVVLHQARLRRYSACSGYVNAELRRYSACSGHVKADLRRIQPAAAM